MKAVMLCTVCLAALLVALPAFAVDESPSTSGEQDVSVVVPGVFWLGWDHDPGKNVGDTVYFNLTEADIVRTDGPGGGGWAERINTDTLSAHSNYDDTSLKCVGPADWDSIGDGDGVFDLWVDWGTGFQHFPLAGSGRWILHHFNGGVNQDWNISYKLTGLGLDDRPDTYNATITYELSHT